MGVDFTHPLAVQLHPPVATTYRPVQHTLEVRLSGRCVELIVCRGRTRFRLFVVAIVRGNQWLALVGWTGTPDAELHFQERA